MSDDERYWQEHVPYDRGHSDGVNGNKVEEYYSDNQHYVDGFKRGREQLRNNFQRMLMNDYGKVGETA